jgi:hypothetical protein
MPELPTSDDWKRYRAGYRRMQEIEARAELATFFDRHGRCTFTIDGKTMTGATAAGAVTSAHGKRLRAHHEAAQHHHHRSKRR